MDWIERLYYEELFCKDTEKTHDKHQRVNRQVEEDSEGDRGIPIKMYSQTSTYKVRKYE